MTQVDGPQWCENGLEVRGGRYPLSVEGAVVSAVGVLVPGVSTLTRLVRWFSMYWALGAYAEEHSLDSEGFRRVLRRSEVALALAFLQHADGERPDVPDYPHAADSIRARIAAGDPRDLDESYSPRRWGFWEQYNGSTATLGLASVTGGALRTGRHPCPPGVSALFRPLFDTAAHRPVTLDDSGPELVYTATAPERVPFRDILCAAGPDEPTGPDRARRESLRVLARSIQLNPRATPVRSMVDTVAFGQAATTDPLLAACPSALDWRGVLLRHYSVGAWRRLWAALVERVRSAGGTATRQDLHDWIAAELGGTARSLDALVADLPATLDSAGDPRPAEDDLGGAHPTVGDDIRRLLVGAARSTELTGRAERMFRGRGDNPFLTPDWVLRRRDDHAAQRPEAFARTLVDDMLAQSRRVAMRKLRLHADGHMTLFSKLHERNGRYFAEQVEGSANVGLRVEQLTALAEQSGVLARGWSVTETGRRVLGLPR